MTDVNEEALVWTAPGPGQWTASIDHFHRPMTPIAAELMGNAFATGFRTTMSRMGAPLETLRMEFVHGIAYVRPVPVIDKPGAKPPPKFILRLACMLHPELRRRQKAATRTLATEGWRTRMNEWRNVEKPFFIRRNRELQAVDLEGLDDPSLLVHLDEAIAHLHRGLIAHFEIAPIEAAPFGMLCVEAEQWGFTPEELLDILVGASPATTAPSLELEPLRAELRARECDPTSLDDIRVCSDEAATLLDAWLADRAWLVSTGYDLDDRTLGEMPGVVLAAVKAPPPQPITHDPVAAFKRRVPENAQDEFERLAHSAREAFALRDENGPLTAEWPIGLVRRALLEVGRRLVDRALLREAALATAATRDEVGAMLSGGDKAAAEAVHRRHEGRMALDLTAVPSVLGEPEPPPDASALPGALGTIAKAATVILGLELAAERRLATLAATADDDELHGVGIGTDFIRGRARVATRPDDLLDGLEPGDIVVTPATAPTWNVVLSAASGLVVEEGGLTGHAAIAAREFGLPTLVGVKGASSRIPDLAELELDTGAGRVRIL